MVVTTADAWAALAAGACNDALEMVGRTQLTEDAVDFVFNKMPSRQVVADSASGFGDRDGYGCGFVFGSGHGHGYGYGDGNGYGDGDGDGNGYGNGYGWCGYGYGDGDGDGYGLDVPQTTCQE